MLYELRNEHWEMISESLSGKKGGFGRSGKDNRRFVGESYVGLPEVWCCGKLCLVCGKWLSVRKRFMRWCEAGV
ncbi:hypothetical protein MIDIC_500001 [Alphaproteobacteria bacterium]